MQNTIDTLLEFEENNPEILDFRFKFDDILIWPHVIRVDLFKHVIFSKPFEIIDLEKDSINLSENIDLINYRNITSSLTLSNIDKNTNYDIVIMASARWKKEINGTFINTLSDYFAVEYCNQTLVIEDSFKNEYTFPKYYNNINYMTRDSIDLMVSDKAQKSSINSEDINSINNMIEFLKERFPFAIDESVYEKFRIVLCNISVKLKYYHMFYTSLFQSIKPKIVFIHGACYGSKGYLIKWLKDWGIKVGEFQHGEHNKNDAPYNYCKLFHKSKEYNKYLPDYLLTYGKYWVKQVRLPVINIPIGNPHLEHTLQNYKNTSNPTKLSKNILIVSQPHLENELWSVAKELDKKNNNLNITFRLHPSQKKNNLNDLFSHINKSKNITINTSGHIYELISNSDFIVGGSSSALYESIAFKKPIFTIAHSFPKKIDKKIAYEFKDADELYNLIIHNSHIKISDSSYYWEHEWKYQYKNFIERLLN